MKRLIASIALLAALATSASAQAPATVDVYGGYSFLRLTSGSSGNGSNFNGFDVSGGVRAYRDWLRADVDYSRHVNTQERTSTTVYTGGSTTYSELRHVARSTFGVGPRFQVPTGGVRPFGRVLVGAMKSAEDLTRIVTGTGDTEGYNIRTKYDRWLATVTLGGGLDVPLGDRFAFRPIQVEYTIGRGQFFANRHTRLSAGLVVNFGSK